MPDDYLRPIEPLIAIVLSCMRLKSAFSSQSHRIVHEQRVRDDDGVNANRRGRSN
jgi:hypothetical protein